ncbi:phenolpthiocerol synthesis polyketide synthase ppsA [Thozetella sp. PMI_491]|nr:phenolpthiocerol synthesis polyketide synthase ppsA [Thozetella sp. PMI_491]
MECNSQRVSYDEVPNQDATTPIAIIGMSFKFPQNLTDANRFWDLLVEGRSTMTKVPEDRFNVDAYYDASREKTGVIAAKGGNFIKEDLAVFDAPFFSITPAEASCIDPQQRWLLECTYRALENAGIPMEVVSGTNTSVHVGSWSREYESMILRDPELEAKYIAIGTGNSMTSNRISWFFNLHGASMSIDTGCSSSLIALHLACQSLQNGDSSMGLVGGCNLIYNPDSSIGLSNLNFLGPDSVCYAFDHQANGYSRGEGIGILVLKRLQDALDQGDTIRAVIRATDSNQDGRTPGITQPSKEAQEQLIRQIYTKAGLDLKTTRFFEAHGTGTSVGDPIEADAIGAVFKEYRSPNDPLYVGALKSNIGHLEAASGVAAIIKTVLALEHGTIPPNVWHDKLNLEISPDWHLKLPSAPIPWPVSGLRRASVNSFGYGGSNVHIVLEDAYHYLELRGLVGRHRTSKTPLIRFEQEEDSSDGLKSADVMGVPPKSPTRVFVWSSQDEDGLKRLADVYVEYLEGVPSQSGSDLLGRLAYTLSCKRTLHPWRSFAIATEIPELILSLKRGLPKLTRATVRDTTPKIGFVFTGQGAQWHAMGRELMVYTVYRESLDSAGAYLRTLGCNWDLLNELSKTAEESTINTPAFSQPICAAVQMALVDLLESWGVRPSAVVGHSSGEIAAAYCARTISQESAWKIAYWRGVLSDGLAKFGRHRGAMLAAGLSPTDVETYLNKLEGGGHAISVGCLNSPKCVTLTGLAESLSKAKELFDRDGVFCQLLNVGNAYHSPLMKDIALEYWMRLGHIGSASSPGAEGEKPLMFSSVTGKLATEEFVRDSGYWVQNLVSLVKFSDGLSSLLSRFAGKRQGENEIKFLLEIGPHGALRRSVSEILDADSYKKDGLILYDSFLTRNEPASETALVAMGRLFCVGYPVDLGKVNNPRAEDGESRILVDLPEYPFNHSRRYWLESRISKNVRFRTHPRNNFLGVQVPDWNPSEARWRMYVKTKGPGNEWVSDHKVSGKILYPGAGMLVMGIEAARQLAEPERTIVGYTLKDFVFEKALIVPTTTSGIEIEISLRTIKKSSGRTGWSEFKLSSFDNDAWETHCRGTILVEYDTEPTPVDGGQSKQNREQDALSRMAELQRRCARTLAPSSLYELCATYGLEFGPNFQTLSSIGYTMNCESSARVSITQDCNSSDVVIHPCTLDGLLQTAFPALTRGGQGSMKLFVPTLLRNAWISDKICKHGPEIQVCTKAAQQGSREAECCILASNHEGTELLAVLESCRMTSVWNEVGPEQIWRRIAYNLEWKPDVDLLDNLQAQGAFKKVDDSVTINSRYFDDLEFVTHYFLYQAAENFALRGITPQTEHLKKYVKWMRRYLKRYEEGMLPQLPLGWMDRVKDHSSVESAIQTIQDSPDGALTLRVGRRLTEILCGDVDALELIFEDDLVTSFYRHGHILTRGYKIVRDYIDSVAHKRPNLRILEVGAGTGGTTVHVLSTLSLHGEGEPGAVRFSQYTFTDISPSFFEKGREEFQQYLGRMEFKTLDIEQSPGSQGFPEGGYDLVIASNVLHATGNLAITLKNARKLLKTGGKLILLEVCNLETTIGASVFGLLPGWWLSCEPQRAWGPLLTENGWDALLKSCGFSGAEIALPDSDNARNHMVTLLVSTALEQEVSPLRSMNLSQDTPVPGYRGTIIVAENNSPSQLQIARALKSGLETLEEIGNLPVRVLSLTDVEHISVSQDVCVFLPELEDPFLANMDPQRYTAIQKLTSAYGLLWPRKSGKLVDPRFGLVTGFAAAIRAENASLRFVILALETTEDISTLVGNIVKAAKVSVYSPYDGTEEDFAEKNGVLHINRVVEANYINDTLANRVIQASAELLPLTVERPVRLEIATPGLLDSIHFVDDLKYETPLGRDEVEVEVRAVGINFRDVVSALGQVPPLLIGGEYSGIVSRIGDDVSSVTVGDHVFALCFESVATFARTTESLVQKAPRGMSFEEVASLPIIYGTCIYAMLRVGRLSAGESILVHSAAGGVGQAAIWLAKRAGAEVYATVGTPDKKQFLIDKFGIPEGHIFSSRDTSFASELMRATKGVGVDMVLNSLAGEFLEATFECIAPYGRFLEIGKKDILSSGHLKMLPFAKNHNLPLTRWLLNEIRSLAESGDIHLPQPIHIYGRQHIEDALRTLQIGKHIGKIVITYETESMAVVPIVRSSRPDYYFDSNATYVIAGGLGGLGRSVARWIVDRGARHLLLLSRSGATSEEAKALLAELRACGTTVEAPACDISDANKLSEVLRTCKDFMPPIKGCVQAAMALKDSMFPNMSLDNYLAGLAPKVQGSWNLHTLLPKGMDFFILLSSGLGIVGGASQANYCAGNAYQDSLARYRTAQGEKAISLDLGMILSVGFVSERPETMGMLRSKGFMSMRETEFLGLLEYYCDPKLPLQSALKSQVISGLETPASFKARGVDEPYWAASPKYRNLYQIGLETEVTSDTADPSRDFRTLLGATRDLEEAALLVTEATIKKLARALSIPEQDIDSTKTMHSYGVDSLVAAEMRNWIAKEMKADVAVFDIMGNTSLANLGGEVARKSQYMHSFEDLSSG